MHIVNRGEMSYDGEHTGTINSQSANSTLSHDVRVLLLSLPFSTLESSKKALLDDVIHSVASHLLHNALHSLLVYIYGVY